MKITKKQFKKAQKIFSKEGLFAEQKNAMLSNIYGDMEQGITQTVISPLNTYFMFFRQKAFAIAGFALIIIVSGTTYASASSLPGDLLYGLKVKVIEPIVLSVKLTEESKNEYKLSLLQKRIDELEKLEEEQKLSNKSQKKSSKAASKNIDDLEKSAIFDEDGDNIRVSEKVNIYNGLIKKDLEIETSVTEDADNVEKTKDVKIDKNINGSVDVNKEINLEKVVETVVKNKDTENSNEEVKEVVEAAQEVIEKADSVEDTKSKIPGL